MGREILIPRPARPASGIWQGTMIAHDVDGFRLPVGSLAARILGCVSA